MEHVIASTIGAVIGGMVGVWLMRSYLRGH